MPTGGLPLEQLEGAAIAQGDKGYDTHAVRQKIEAHGAAPNIPRKITRTWKNCFSPVLYRDRNAIDGMLDLISDFCRITTRYDIGGLETAITGVRRHRRIWIGQADLLMASTLLAIAFSTGLDQVGLCSGLARWIVIVLGYCGIGVPNTEALPRHIGSDQRSVDMHHLAACNPCGHACLHSADEHGTESIGAPTLTDACQA